MRTGLWAAFWWAPPSHGHLCGKQSCPYPTHEGTEVREVVNPQARVDGPDTTAYQCGSRARVSESSDPLGKKCAC